jgi:hypothetical protein
MNIDLPFNSAFAQAWQEWLEYRKERRLPAYKPTGLKKTLSRLIDLAGNNETEAIKIIDYSISQNYQGLFKEKRYEQQNTNLRKEVQAEFNKRYGGWQ